MTMHLRAASAIAFFLAPVVSGQWAKAPDATLQLSDGDGDEVQAKVRRVTDESTYVSWYDSDPDGAPAFGYDVRLQRLSPNGVGQWTAGGIVVADRGFSSTQDYGMDASPDGSAWLAFRDDRLTGIQITATRVTSEGVQSFGPTGVQLTNTSDFLAAPRVAATADGGAVVAWTQSGSVRLQRLASDGSTVGSELTVPAGGATNTLSDLRASGDEVIFSWISQTGGFFGPRHLIAQKLSSSMVPQWGAGAVIFDTGSLQIANTPALHPDGSGGAVFSWYGVSPLQSYAQHVLSDGSLAFGAGGAEVSTNGAQIRVSPSVSYDASTGETYVFWVEQNGAQSLSGLSGQKFDAAGNRQWGSFGIEFVPVGANGVGNVRVRARAGGATVVWVETPTFSNGQLFGLTVDASGSGQHAVTDVADTPSQLSRLAATDGSFGDVVVAWQGDSGAGNVLLAQNLNPSGEIGPAAGGVTRNAGGNLQTYTATVGPLGGAVDAEVDLAATGHAFALLLGYTAPAEIPFDGQVILVDFTGPEVLNLPAAIGDPAQFHLPVPNLPIFCGLKLSTQAIHVDTVMDPLLTNAIDFYLGL